MTVYEFNMISTYSVVPAACICLKRFPVILPSYRPFAYFIWAGLANELLTTLLHVNRRSSIINGNIYVLLEFYLMLWLFYNWGKEHHPAKVYKGLALLVGALWAADTLIHSISLLNFIYRAVHSFIMVCLSIDGLNHLLMTEKRKVLYHPGFIIKLAFLVFFAFKVFYEVLFYANLSFVPLFYEKLFTIFLFINLLCNLLYMLSSLWIPTRQKFSMPY